MAQSFKRHNYVQNSIFLNVGVNLINRFHVDTLFTVVLILTNALPLLISKKFTIVITKPIVQITMVHILVHVKMVSLVMVKCVKI